MRAVIGGLLAVCCAAASTACSHRPTPPATISSETPASATPSAAVSTPTTASPTPSLLPTATTPLLTGAAVSPGEIPPTISSYAAHDDSSGALAFASYFFKALDWSIATTNPNLLRPISAASCTTCEGYIRDIDAVEAAGGRSTGGRLDVTSLSISQGDLVKADFVVEVTFRQQIQVLISSAGAAPATYPPLRNPGINYLYVSWHGGWQAEEIGRP